MDRFVNNLIELFLGLGGFGLVVASLTLVTCVGAYLFEHAVFIRNKVLRRLLGAIDVVVTIVLCIMITTFYFTLLGAGG